MRNLSAVLGALVLALANQASAAWGDRDCSFGTAGSATVSGFAFAVAREADGNLLVRSGTPSSSNLTRMTPDGTVLGASFGTAFFQDDATDVVLPSGNILYATSKNPFNSSTPIGVARITPAGTLDATFGNGGYATNAGLDGASAGPLVQTDGRIVVGGTSAGAHALARFNADGSPDATFGTGGIAVPGGGNRYWSIALQPDGRILALSGGLTRHLASGAIDTTFGSGGTVSVGGATDFRWVRLLPSGNILIAGSSFGVNNALQLVLLDPAGAILKSRLATTSLLPSNQNGIRTSNSPATPVSITSDGKVLVNGVAGGGVLARYTADLDDDASAFLDFSPTLTFEQPDGRFITGSLDGHAMRRQLGETNAATCTATSITLDSSPNPSAYRQTVTLQATVSSPSGTPTGTVVFRSGAVTIGNPVPVGAGSVTATTKPEVGTNQITAQFVPTGMFATSMSPPVAQVVRPGLVAVGFNGPSLGPNTITVGVEFHGPSSGTVTVDYATADNSAIAGVDYVATSGTLTFPNVTLASQQIPIQILAHPTPHPPRQFFLTLSNAVNAELSVPVGVVTLNYQSGSGALSIYVDNPSVLEGQSGTTLLGFMVSLSRSQTSKVTVDFATADDTAVAGVDYTAKSGTLTFQPGQTQQWVMVPVAGNTALQSNRRIFLNLSNPSAGTLATAQGIGTIVDDDPAGAASALAMYRLYSNATKEHLYTTDANEYAVLGTQNWAQEGTAFQLFGNTGSFGLQYTIPLFRMYHPGIRQHHWTTDANEVQVLASQGAWQYEGIPGYLLPGSDAGTTSLFRLMYTSPPLHLWTTDANEKSVLSTQYGWTYEGIVGEVLP